MVTKTRQDIIMIAALISFGLVMAYLTYLSGHFFRNRILQQDILTIAERWSGYVEKAPTDTSFFDALRKEAAHDGILALKVIGAKGQSAHEEIGQHARDFSFKFLPLPVLGMPQHESYEVEYEDGVNHLAQVLIKLPVARPDAAYLQIGVDQTANARVLMRTFGFFSVATAVFVWIALFIPALVVWSRMRERAAIEKRMHHLAHHDALTGLPNRTFFNMRLEEALERVKRNKTQLALLCLDLDKFKEVNDTLGHLFGDMLLVQVARRFEDIVRSKDMIARLGGDEFVIISEDVKGTENTIQLAKRLVDNLAKPYVLDGNTVVAAASIGIALAPDNGMTAGDLLKNADLALYRAKAEARGSFRFFEKDMDAELQLRRDLESDLREAVIRGGFVLYYQPQYDLHTSSLVGYEALVRWPHPTKGFISPIDFINLAEETGLIIPLGEWILRRACLDAQIWPEHIKIAVNLSPAQFMKNDVASMVKRVVRETGISPTRLELEITESLLLQDTDNIIEQLTRLRDFGVTIAMDDFGTGYSSLSYLSRFPFDKIKIDQSFVQSLDTDPSVAAIVNSIVSLGRTLSMTVIAEGVETETQANILRDAGCKHVQGFLFGKPVPTSASVTEAPKTYDQMMAKLSEEYPSVSPLMEKPGGVPRVA